MRRIQGSSYVIIHKNEWERIKEQGRATDEEVPINPREESIEELNKLSQKWIKSWPNSFQGAADRLEKKNEDKKKRESALIRQYAKKQTGKSSSSEGIKNAKQIIFQNSSYGKQLWGALIESKILEEREAQIKFNNKLKKQKATFDKTQELLNTLPALNTDEDENKKRRKSIAVDYAKMNMELEKIKRATEAKTKEEEILCKKIDDALIKPFIEKEEEITFKRLQKEVVEKYNAEQKEIAKLRAIREVKEDALIEFHRKEKDRMQCKFNATNKKIINDYQNSTKSKYVYDLIEKDQIKKFKEYDEFVEKGVKRHEEKQEADDLKENEKKTAKTQKKRVRITVPTEMHSCPEEDKKKSITCETSSLLMKTRASKLKGKRETEYKFSDPPLTATEPLSLKEKLKEREKEKSPFSGTDASHAQFAEQAVTVLQDCKYKQLPRKIIQEYIKTNKLDATSLAVLKKCDSQI